MRMLLEPKRYLSVLAFIGIVAPAVFIDNRVVTTVSAPSDVFMEDMTWKEIDCAIKERNTRKRNGLIIIQGFIKMYM